MRASKDEMLDKAKKSNRVIYLCAKRACLVPSHVLAFSFSPSCC